MSKTSKHTRQPTGNSPKPARAPRGTKGATTKEPEEPGEPEAPGAGDFDDDDNRITQRNPVQRGHDAEPPA